MGLYNNVLNAARIPVRDAEDELLYLVFKTSSLSSVL